MRPLFGTGHPKRARLFFLARLRFFPFFSFLPFSPPSSVFFFPFLLQAQRSPNAEQSGTGAYIIPVWSTFTIFLVLSPSVLLITGTLFFSDGPVVSFPEGIRSTLLFSEWPPALYLFLLSFFRAIARGRISSYLSLFFFYGM